MEAVKIFKLKGGKSGGGGGADNLFPHIDPLYW